jgi:hypothetical protein
MIKTAPDTLGYPGFTRLDLQWKMLAELEGGTAPPIVFIHLLSEVGEVLRTFDHALPFGWALGNEQLDTTLLYQSVLAPSLPTGTYGLTMGLYDVSGRRWPLQVAGEEVGQHEYSIGTLSVDEGSEPGPMSYFSSSWLDSEAGTDVQVLGSRWLTDEGTIRMSALGSRGELFLQFRIPGPAPGGEELVLDEGAAVQRVSLTSVCASSTNEVEGEGRHQVVLAMSPDLLDAEASTECEVVIRPNFHLLDTSDVTQRALVLEVVAWSSEA